MKAIKFFFLFVIIFTIFGCVKDDNIRDVGYTDYSIINGPTSGLVNGNDTITCTTTDSVLLLIGDAMGRFTDDMIKDGLDSAIVRLEHMQDSVRINATTTDSEVLQLFATYLHMDSNIVRNYFEVISQNATIILDTTYADELVNSIFCYALNFSSIGKENSIEMRWLITNLLEAMGVDVPCSYQFAIGILETAAVTAGTASSCAITLGIGCVIGGGGVIGEFLNLYNVVNECHGQWGG